MRFFKNDTVQVLFTTFVGLFIGAGLGGIPFNILAFHVIPWTSDLLTRTENKTLTAADLALFIRAIEDIEYTRMVMDIGIPTGAALFAIMGLIYGISSTCNEDTYDEDEMQTETHATELAPVMTERTSLLPTTTV